MAIDNKKQYEDMTFEEFEEESRRRILAAIGEGKFKETHFMMIQWAYHNGFQNAEKLQNKQKKG